MSFNTLCTFNTFNKFSLYNTVMKTTNWITYGYPLVNSNLPMAFCWEKNLQTESCNTNDKVGLQHFKMW